MPRLDFLRKYVTRAEVTELPFLNCVMLEALRFETPVPFASHTVLSKTCKVGKLTIKPGTMMLMNIRGLHHNSNEWQRPKEFLPDRFDASNELWLTPAGTKRSAFSFFPFNGGKRICFGKTFAEASLKIVATYLTQNFDMAFEETDKYPDTNHLPLSQLNQSETPPIPVVLTKRRD